RSTLFPYTTLFRSLSFSRTSQKAGVELMECEPVAFSSYARLEGHDRFSRLPQHPMRKFQPLHRDFCDFPAPVELLGEIGAGGWFAPLCSHAGTESEKCYCFDKEACTIPTLALQVVERLPAGRRAVFDLA